MSTFMFQTREQFFTMLVSVFLVFCFFLSGAKIMDETTNNSRGGVLLTSCVRRSDWALRNALSVFVLRRSAVRCGPLHEKHHNIGGWSELFQTQSKTLQQFGQCEGFSWVTVLITGRGARRIHSIRGCLGCFIIKGNMKQCVKEEVKELFEVCRNY